MMRQCGCCARMFWYDGTTRTLCFLVFCQDCTRAFVYILGGEPK